MDPKDATGNEGAHGDKDGDGVSNYDEMIAGTNPDNMNDFLQADITISNDQAIITWNTEVDLNYLPEYSGELVPSDWNSAGPMRTAFSNQESQVDADLESVTTRFYRVLVVP